MRLFQITDPQISLSWIPFDFHILYKQVYLFCVTLFFHHSWGYMGRSFQIQMLDCVL